MSTKISALPVITNFANDDLLYLIAGGDSHNISVEDFTKGLDGALLNFSSLGADGLLQIIEGIPQITDGARKVVGSGEAGDRLVLDSFTDQDGGLGFRILHEDGENYKSLTLSKLYGENGYFSVGLNAQELRVGNGDNYIGNNGNSDFGDGTMHIEYNSVHINANDFQVNTIRINNLPTSTEGLQLGDIFNDGGFLKIVD